MTNFCRRPPLPFFAEPKGTCRWCGQSVEKPQKHFHIECAAAYKLAVNSGAQRLICWGRDKGVCKKCETPTSDWQADHIVALHTIPESQLEDFPNCLRFWAAGNLQTLCLKCHAEKTAAEAWVRAKVKRIRARIEGTRRERKKIPTRQPYIDNTKYIA